MTAIYRRSARENATTSRVSILLPKSTLTDRDLQFQETSIVVDDETDAAFLRRRQQLQCPSLAWRGFATLCTVRVRTEDPLHPGAPSSRGGGSIPADLEIRAHTDL
jgi:hypothetical protein